MRTRNQWAAKVLAGAVAATLGGQAWADSTWTPTAAGTSYLWSDVANWDGGVPNGVDAVANVNIDIAGAQTINLDQDVTLGTLRLGDANGSAGMVIVPDAVTPGSITFDTTSGPALFTLSGPGSVNTALNVGVTLNTDLVMHFNGSQVLTTGSNASDPPAFNLGSHNLTITGSAANTPTWTIIGDLQGSGTITYSGLGGLFLSGSSAKSFTGKIILNSGRNGTSNGASLVMIGEGVSVKNASEIEVNGFVDSINGNGLNQLGGLMRVGYGTAFVNNPGQRLTTGTVTLNGGSIEMGGQGAQTSGLTPWTSGEELTQDTNALTKFNSGYSLVFIGSTSTTAGNRWHSTEIERGAGATAFIRGGSNGQTVGVRARVTAGNGASFNIGSGGAVGTTSMSIIPWMSAANGNNNAQSGDGFAVYDTTQLAPGVGGLPATDVGFRALTNAEYATSITSGAANNVKVSTFAALASDATVNSLWYTHASTVSNIGAGRVLTITSGGLYFSGATGGIGVSGDAAAGTINFGTREGVIWANGSNTVGGNVNTIGAAIVGSGGLTKAGAGTLVLTGNNNYTGDTHVSGGILRVGNGTNNSQLGVTGNVYVAAGATLQLYNDDAISDEAIVSLAQHGLFNGKIFLADGIEETVGGLVLGDVMQAVGTWGATGSGATFINDAYFSGTGILNVVPEPGMLAVSVLGGAMLLGRRRRQIA